MLMRSSFAGAAALLLAACSTDGSSQSPASAPPPAPALISKGVVSAADPRAAEAGVAMLRKGGSATDAAIATMLALTVVEPQSSGIGGGGFYVRAAGDGDVQSIDGRETAPEAAGPDWFLDAEGKPLGFMEAVIGGRSVGVPGNIALAARAHEQHGKLAWPELFEPAIALARNGFSVTERFRTFLARSKARAALTPLGETLFYGADGEPVPAGTIVRNPDLAASLEWIAQVGAEGFYGAENGEALASVIAEATPGDAVMTLNDVAGYEAKQRPPVCASYRRYRICGMGPPSSGATTVLAILKQLERFDLGALGPDSAAFWHLFAESQRLAYADRELFLADSDFVPVPVAGLVDDEYLAERGRLISATSAMGEATAGSPPTGEAPLTALADGNEPEENGTSHFVAADKWGNAVSYTSTIEGSFGSGLMYRGFYLNNELTDFSFSPEQEGKPVANRVEGGKRPRSSMAPSVVYDADGNLVLAIGAAGGGTIPVQVAKALIGYIDFGLNAEAAIALPGLYAPGDTVFVEPGSALEDMIPQLQALGHDRVIPRAMPFKANAAQRTGTGWQGAADPRSEGAAIAE